jgi:short-subunit dehydrogenase
MIAVNLTGAMLLSRLVLPGMMDRNHGRLLFVASIQGIAGTPGFVSYSATKGGMLRFTEALGRELVHHPIRITTVLPPTVQTEAFRRAKEEASGMMRWNLFPPIPIDQVARRAVRGMLAGEPLVYAGAESALAAMVNRVSRGLMGFILERSFQEQEAPST